MYRIGWIVLGIFYLFAGFNHFRDPAFYLPLIPDYFPLPEVINYLSGAIEIVLGALIFIKPVRSFASWGIIILLILFIPAHIHLINLGGCAGKLCVPEWIAWARLVIIHPLLIYWAYVYTKSV